MAIVRELITTLGYKVDETGLNQYEAGFRRIRTLALGFASAMGLAFGASKISEFVDDLYESGKEVNKLRAQITNLVRPMDDINTIMERGFQIAENTRFAYTDVLETFKELLNVSRETGTSQEDLLSSTENIYKALRIDRASVDQIHSLWSTINRIFAVGQARPMTIGRIERLSPTFYRMLQEYFERTTGSSDLRELAKQHKITTTAILAAVKSISPEMEARFKNVPVNLAQGFTYARNQLVLLMSNFIRFSRLSILLGTALVRLVNLVKDFFQWLDHAVGGLTRVFEVLGYALAVVLGPWLIRQLALATFWTLRWAAATLAANWPWLLLGAAIVGVGIAIQDLVYWIQGKGSALTSWLGPFEDFKKEFGNLDVFSPFRAISDLFQGDFRGALEELKISLTTISGLVVTIFAGFTLWGGLRFAGLIASLLGISKAAKEAAAATAAAGAGGAGVGAAGGGAAAAAGGGFFARMFRLLPLAMLGFTGGAGGEDPAFSKEKNDEYMRNFPGGQSGAVGDWFRRNFGYLAPGMGTSGKIFDIPPGAVDKPTIDNRNQSVTVTHSPTNNITVTTEDQSTLANTIRDKMADIGRATTDAIVKQILTASPRTEAATQ